jgi:hypothetical protein
MRKRDMASSRLTDDGRCVITTPGSGYEVGHVFFVIGSGATYGIPASDWAVRLLTSQPSNGHGKPWGEGVSYAEAELALAIGLGLIHPSLVEEPAEPPAAA